MSISAAIQYFKKNLRKILFTTPSHSQGVYVPPVVEKYLGRKYFENDLSEIDCLDNLSNPKHCIKESMKNAAEVYGAQTTFYLTNGSSSGIVALMCACLGVGDKVLINRNCHKSVYNGLVLSGAFPVWTDIEVDEEWDFIKPITPELIESALLSNSGIKAVIITNPTYEGMIADVEKIVTVCQKYGVILIVDEAHGALWNFSESFPQTALQQGADASVQSLHKTAGAINPCALLHLSKNSKISAEKVQEALNLINTTSPSYPALLDIEFTVDFLNTKEGKKQINELISNIKDFQKKLMECDNIRIYCVQNDITKLLIQIEGLSGISLSEILYNEHNIEVEMASERSILCLTGIGTTKNKLNKLLKALIKIAKNANSYNSSPQVSSCLSYIKPEIACTPRQAFYAKSVEIDFDKSVGKIAKSMQLDYPPGIPIIIPGEVIKQQHLDYLKKHCDTIKVIV